MSWDDEDFEVPTSSKVAGSWEDEVDDEPVLESWDVDSEEEREKEKAKQAEQEAAKKKKEAEAAKKKPAKPVKAAKGKAGAKVILEIDKVDEKTRKEMLRQAELDSDLNNAADLFGGLGVADEHPRARATRLAAESSDDVDSAPILTADTPIDAHPLFQVETKQDFEKLRKAISPALTKTANVSSLNYSSALAITLIKDLCGPLSVENLRKVTSTLAVVMKEKEKAERDARLAKSGTAVGGAGKKKAKPAAKSSLGSNSFKKDLDYDTTNYDDDDFQDDDFM